MQVLNKTTVYQRLQDIFNQCQNDHRRGQDAAIRELVGQVTISFVKHYQLLNVI